MPYGHDIAHSCTPKTYYEATLTISRLRKTLFSRLYEGSNPLLITVERGFGQAMLVSNQLERLLTG